MVGGERMAVLAAQLEVQGLALGPEELPRRLRGLRAAFEDYREALGPVAPGTSGVPLA